MVVVVALNPMIQTAKASDNAQNGADVLMASLSAFLLQNLQLTRENTRGILHAALAKFNIFSSVGAHATDRTNSRKD